MEAIAMAVAEDTAVRSGLEEIPHVSVDDEFEMLAFDLWRRASCQGGAGEVPCRDMEESILAPR